MISTITKCDIAGRREKNVGVPSNMGGEDQEDTENLSGQDQFDIEII